ncbi:hypothetical protein [Sessilibacter corallicola]|uniref:Uncharacterized protein n=1 Tax=Sessilibacter corallicola TaxID=2904075 RepID=A0ABQ0A5V7_9GAMM
MQYTKALIDLIQKARRHAPSDVKSRIKLSDPNVLSELESIYKASDDNTFKNIVKDVFEQAGDGWLSKLEQSIISPPVHTVQSEHDVHPALSSSFIKGDIAELLQKVD